MSGTVDGARWDTERITVVAGLTVGWVLGFAGGMFEPGVARDVSWALSSVGIMAAAAVLAIRQAARDVPLAAGFALLVVGEAVIHTQGAGGVDAAAAAAFAYVPALLLTATSTWPPLWARLSALGSAVAFAVHAGLYLAGEQPAVDGAAMSVGYGLLALTMIGWSLRVVRRT